jgi:hypothetical protein
LHSPGPNLTFGYIAGRDIADSVLDEEHFAATADTLEEAVGRMLAN